MTKSKSAIADPLFMGLDSSTQSLKAVIIDEKLNVMGEYGVNFDADLPEFKTEGGAHHGDDGLTVTSPPLMWVKALDLVLNKMKDDSFPFSRVAAISGSGQQHGSVWLKEHAQDVLQGVESGSTLADQLGSIFSLKGSPIWMDSSTTAQCEDREMMLGGAQAVAELTGSRAYERFTGNQIAKIYQQNPDVYGATEHICLVSSFITSLLIGQYAPIDTSDGSGMNLMDIRSKTWSPGALDCTAPGLAYRLGGIAPSHEQAGKVHKYFVDEYGFDASCDVIVFSGDNPNSLAGLRLRHTGDIAISLGTSDTVFGSLAEPKPSADEGHIFVNPVDPNAYMAMICYKNGSLTREYVRDLCKVESWKEYGELVDQSPVGNEGQIGFYIREPEITPTILQTGVHRFDGNGEKVESFTKAAEARAVLEGQFLSMRIHGSRIGLAPATILATGGASVDPAVIRVMADVFGVPVFVGESANSAALGAAYRALHGWECSENDRFVEFAEILSEAPPFQKATDPDMDAHAVYTSMLDRYTELEKRIMG